ncbi:MAG: ATPase [Bacteroidales bacterium]|nr:ATPase [Bacteroidales bacterium]
MKKYSFLVHHQDYRNFLDELQELGVIDIIESDVELDDEMRDKIFLVKQVQNRIKFLKKRKIESEPAKESEWDGMDLLESINQLEQEQEQLQLQLNALKKEYINARPWGDYSEDTILKLEDAGLNLNFFVCPEKKFKDEWNEKYNIEIVNTLQSAVYFIVIRQGDEEIDIDAEELTIPERPVSEVVTEQKKTEARIHEINDTYDEYAKKYFDILERTLNTLESETDLKKAILHTKKEAEDKLMVLEGWVPNPKEEDVRNFAEDKGIVYITAKPDKDDKPPVLLKNNKFANLFEPIGSLFSLPDYKEIDLTPFFAPFFMMFFGFCLGDAGYGILFVIAGTLLKYKLDKKFRPILSLLQWLGIGTIIFGILTGTFFGINLLEIESLGNLRNIMLNNDQVFWLAPIIGLIQILVGISIRTINQIKQNGFVYGLSSIGWIILIVALLDILLLKLSGFVGNILLYIGLFLIVFFSDPKASILGRIGKGLWDLYGITGIFGDVLSYIRLFALGVSSAILGFVINDIAMQILATGPVIGHILCGIFLILGHSMNIAIASLGSFVHPMRLTFVEFYKNAGFSGGGKKYKPFSNKRKTI